jgi:DNA-binding LacI/PurR family transcriptional regulator
LLADALESSANDEMAFGLIRALHEHGRRVPEDVSVVGFDGIALSEFSSPPLTTVKQDFQRVGHELVRLVLEQIRSKVSVPRDRVLIPTELIVRGTTTHPAAR